MELIGSKPDRKVIFYFIGGILAGTISLCLPVCSTGVPLSFIDALFTATSAVCVTGLTVLDTGQDFTLFGQIVIMVLIQLGGLGIMTFASALLISMAPRLSFKDRFVISLTLGGDQQVKTGSLLKAVILTAFSAELAGALLLFLKFRTEYPFGQAVFHAVFHSVSAFCNAGFSTFEGGLEGYRDDLTVILIFSALIISGGLGFIVIREALLKIKQPGHRFSTHSKLSLAVTAGLLVIGTAAFLSAEYENVFAGMSTVKAVGNAFFQAVTTRTAGFNTVPQVNLTEVSLLMTIILMFIGACPGSTGGGIKTTTFGVLLLLGYNRFLGRSSVKAFRRSVSVDSVNRALTVLLVALAVVLVMFVLLMFAEERPPSHQLAHSWFVESLFEVISAFGTVGLSLGMTGQLHTYGKIIIIILMFVGRVGLLTLVLNLARPPQRGEVVYLDEQVMVG
ncbi:MAG: TrkH family potassium uptake protein [Candidatus Zixiibacteriota bacterium]